AGLHWLPAAPDAGAAAIVRAGRAFWSGPGRCSAVAVGARDAAWGAAALAESRAAVPWPTGGGEPWIWPDAGHLLPERHGAELARRAVEYFRP
ncbi:tRNA adenosine(34) deaminase TadA, partial [Paracidovorax avenae]